MGQCAQGSKKAHPLTPLVTFFVLLGTGVATVLLSLRQSHKVPTELPIFVKPSDAKQDHTPTDHQINIRFTDLTLTVGKKGSPKSVLQGISGEFKAGVVTAVMGPSGAGKTTLLSVLLGKANGQSGGSIQINGKDGSLAKLSGRVGMVPQDDTMLRTLTVYEVLKYSALTRLPDTLSRVQKLAVVNEAIQVLGLDHVRNSVIGDEKTRGISGGQRKRVSIGMELVAMPSVLFLDEPTSGLDATSSKSVVESLHRIAQQGKTVVAVIHQPRYEIFNLFDSVLLLAKGGRTAYFGPATECKSHFESIGYPCPPLCNPSDFFMDAVSGRIVGRQQSASQDDETSSVPEDLSNLVLSHSKQEGAKAVDGIVAAWKERVKSNPGDASSIAPSTAKSDKELCADSTQPGAWSQFLAHVQLCAVQDYREAGAVIRDIVLQLLPGLIMGAVAFDKEIFGPPVPQQIVDICPAIVRKRCETESVTTITLLFNLFFTVMVTSAANANNGSQLFSRYPEVLKRQARTMDTKGLFLFYLAKITFDLWAIVRSSFGWLVFYFFLLGPRGSFVEWYAVMFCFSFASYGLGYLVSFLVSHDKAAVVATVCGIAWSVTSGLSPTLNEVADLSVLQVFWWASYTRWSAEAITLLFTEGYPAHYRVKAFLDTFGFEAGGWTRAVAITFAIGIGYRVLAFLFMWAKHRKGKL